MDDISEWHLQEAGPERAKRLDVAGALEAVIAFVGLRIQEVARRQRALYAAGDAGASC